MEYMRLPLQASILQVTSSDPKNDRFGTAFAVARNGATTYLASCAHVIRDVGGEGQVMVNSIPARVVVSGSPDGPDDVAVLGAELPVGVMPIGLEFSAEPGLLCTVHGFNELPGVRGVYQLMSISGKLGPLTPLQRRLAKRQIAAWYIESAQDLTPGLSGSPVIDEVTGEAIGVAALSFFDQHKGIAISVDALRQMWPRGLPHLEKPRVKYKGIELIYVSGGEFTMGTGQRQAVALAQAEGRPEFHREYPNGKIRTQGYYIARFPVTNAQYSQFLEATGWLVPYRDDDMSKPFNWNRNTRRYPEGMDDHPVVLVSWRDAWQYCNWIGGRLPTEAEWEKAARGTDAREWPWGNDWDPQRCNTIESGRKWLTPVGRFSPAGDSPYDIADMSGNIWEWCSSVADPYPYDSEDGRENVAAIGARVLRGGAWGTNRYLARCASRNWAQPDDYGFTIGFRVAMSKDAAFLWEVND